MEEAEEAMVVEVAATTREVVVVADEASTTLVPARHRRVDSAPLLGTMCSTTDTSKAAADQMRTSWEKLVPYVGTHYGQDISNELQNKVTVILAEPVHSPTVMARHATRELMIRNGQENLHQARLAQQTILEAIVDAGTDPEAPMKLAILNNAIAQGEFEQNMEVPIEMSDSEKTQYRNEWRSYRE